MSLPGLVMGLVIVAGVLLFVLTPFLRPAESGTAVDVLIEKQRERLLMVYERVLGNIRDLDEDLTTNKMSEADYSAERELWVQRGIQVLKTLDAVNAKQILTSSSAADDIDRAIDDQIEAAVAIYRSKVNT